MKLRGSPPIAIQPDGLENFSIPSPSQQQKSYIEALVSTLIETTPDPRFEQLLNGLVYELFFPKDFHERNIHLFDACSRAGLDRHEELKGEALSEATRSLANEIFSTSHKIYQMLFNLRTLDVVRIIEGEE